MHELPQSHCRDNREGTLFSWLHIYYAHLASVRFEHSVCRGSLMTTNVRFQCQISFRLVSLSVDSFILIEILLRLSHECSGVNFLSIYTYYFVGGFQPPFFKASILDSGFPRFLKYLLCFPFFLFHPLLRYYSPFCPNPIHQPSLHIINGFKEISKRWFHQFTCC